VRNNEGHLDSFDETEGDINCTPHRQQFVSQHLDDSTREMLDADSQYFLHQADEQLLTQASELGKHAIMRLQELKSKLHSIHDVRGIGLQIGVELESKSKSDLAERVLYGCLQRGLSFKVSDGNVLTLSPPLTISRAEMDEALDILSVTLAECE
jgi:4-aminobutyrate aminotransferase-like enzyme